MTWQTGFPTYHAAMVAFESDEKVGTLIRGFCERRADTLDDANLLDDLLDCYAELTGFVIQKSPDGLFRVWTGED